MRESSGSREKSDSGELKRYYRPQHIVSCKLEGELVLFDTFSGEYFSLNETAANIYAEAGQTPETARCLTFAREELPEATVSVLKNLLEELCNKGLLACVEDDAEPARPCSDIRSQALPTMLSPLPRIDSWGHVMSDTHFTPPPSMSGG